VGAGEAEDGAVAAVVAVGLAGQGLFDGGGGGDGWDGALG
jgi:hypothetical protein